jgi:hypothetical protein
MCGSARYGARLGANVTVCGGVVYHRPMRKLAIATAVLGAVALAAPSSARAEGLGIGVFFGEPTGLDLKIDLQARSSLDIVLGATTFRDGRTNYGHLSYLYTLVAARGQSVVVPIRLGIGGAIFGNSDNIEGLVRVPFELGLRFRRTPIEIYGEITPVIVLTNDADFDVMGGIGIRFYF